ncbi:MAG: hypothetical protein ACI4HJ_00795 [Ruminococcus sp.]
MKKIICIVGIIVSLAVIVKGITTYKNANNSFVTSNMKFGADFYTEIFEEVEQIKASARSIDNAIYEVGGLLLVSIGGISLCNSLKYFSDAFDINKKTKKDIDKTTEIQ